MLNDEVVSQSKKSNMRTYIRVYIYIYKYIYIYTYNYTKGRKFFHDAIISILLMYNTIVFMTV